MEDYFYGNIIKDIKINIMSPPGRNIIAKPWRTDTGTGAGAYSEILKVALNTQRHHR